MTKWLLAGAALMLAAGCGEAETDAASTEVIDLRLDTASSVVPDNSAGNGTIVIRRNGESVPLDEWAVEVSFTHDITLPERDHPQADPDLYVIVTDPGGELSEKDARLVANEARELADKQAACPDVCMHCPEDAAFLCAALCGM